MDLKGFPRNDSILGTGNCIGCWFCGGLIHPFFSIGHPADIQLMVLVGNSSKKRCWETDCIIFSEGPIGPSFQKHFEISEVKTPQSASTAPFKLLKLHMARTTFQQNAVDRERADKYSCTFGVCGPFINLQICCIQQPRCLNSEHVHSIWDMFSV